MNIRILGLVASACLTMGAIAGCGGSSSGTASPSAGSGLTAPATGGSGQASQFPAQPSRATPENSNPDVGQASSQVGAKRDNVPGASNVAKGSTISDAPGRAKGDARYASGSHDRITATGSVQRARSTLAASRDDNQTTHPVALDPCRLVGRSQAQAIAGEAVTSAIEAPLGPTCIYKLRSQKEITLSVQTVNYSQVTRHLQKRQPLSIASHAGYCGTLGTQMLFLRLANGQVLNVTAPCGMARQLAAVAVGHLSA